MDKIKTTVQSYIQKNNQEFQRYKSWNHCYEAFDDSKLDNDFLALHLGFYLASWGMYRGSSGLLQKDYKVHHGAVEIIKANWTLRCSGENEVTHSSLPKILELIKQLQQHYQKFAFVTLKGKNKHINPTDTLISKILLGTLGCVPAFDRFFIDGVKETIPKMQQFKSLKEKNLIKLFDFANCNEELDQLKNDYHKYPKMKLIDMYFWQVGYDLG